MIDKFPQAIHFGDDSSTIPEDEMLDLDYGQLTPVLTKAIQEQQAHIDGLKAENAEQAQQIDELRSLLEQMNARVSALEGN